MQPVASRQGPFWGLPTGKNSWLWTPDGANAGTVQATSNKPADSLFCAGQSFLSDGRLLVVGGGGDGTGPRHNHGSIFDPTPSIESWTRTVGNGTPGNGDMAFYRSTLPLSRWETTPDGCWWYQVTTPAETMCTNWKCTWKRLTGLRWYGDLEERAIQVLIIRSHRSIRA